MLLHKVYIKQNNIRFDFANLKYLTGNNPHLLSMAKRIETLANVKHKLTEWYKFPTLQLYHTI